MFFLKLISFYFVAHLLYMPCYGKEKDVNISEELHVHTITSKANIPTHSLAQNIEETGKELFSQGEKYFLGIGIEEDRDQAFQLFFKALEKEYIGAINLVLSQKLEINHQHIPSNPYFKFLEYVVNQGYFNTPHFSNGIKINYGESLFKLGKMYIEQKPPNFKEGVKWIFEAGRAYNYAGTIKFINRESIRTPTGLNNKQYFQFIKSAAENGYLNSPEYSDPLIVLAAMYLLNEVTPIDTNEAFNSLKLATDAGSKIALEIILKGMKEISQLEGSWPIDKLKIFDMRSIALKRRYAPVLFDEATRPFPPLIQLGDNAIITEIPQTNPECLSLITEAAAAGYPPAQNSLGSAYYHGALGLAIDYDKAQDLFLAAAVQKDEKAEFNLGVFHHEGRAFPPNYAKAIYWYHRSLRPNYKLAGNQLEKLLSFDESSMAVSSISPTNLQKFDSVTHNLNVLSGFLGSLDIFYDTEITGNHNSIFSLLANMVANWTRTLDLIKEPPSVGLLITCLLPRILSNGQEEVKLSLLSAQTDEISSHEYKKRFYLSLGGKAPALSNTIMKIIQSSEAQQSETEEFISKLKDQRSYIQDFISKSSAQEIKTVDEIIAIAEELQKFLEDFVVNNAPERNKSYVAYRKKHW